MWAAFARQVAAYAITRRGKKLFALIGVLALCFAAALLVDMQLYLSATFTTVLACFSAAAVVVQHAKIKQAERERLVRKAEAARQRALAAQARLDRIDSAKAAAKAAVRDTFVGAARTARTAVVDVTKEAAAVASETVDAVSRSANAVADAVNDAALRAADAVTEAVGGTAGHLMARTTTGAEAMARAGLVRVVKGWRTLRGDQGLVP